MTDIAKIAAGLTKAQRRAVPLLTDDWQAGPLLPIYVTTVVRNLCDKGVAEQDFMDEGPPAYSIASTEFTVRLSACWHYRLTPLGLAVRAHLIASTQGDA